MINFSKNRITLILLTFFLFSCKGSSSIDDGIYIEKPITGIDPIFHESLGHYNEFASAFRLTNDIQYVYYTRNAIKFDKTSDTIAVRKATLKDNDWVYGNYKTILTPTENSWDSRIFSPDVIRGIFNYQGETYNYLMAYAGSNDLERMNAQIGLAVAKNPDDQFIKVGTTPIVKFDKTEQSTTGMRDTKGAQEPSLISYNREGQVQLFYSWYGNFNASYCIEIDASNLDNLVVGGRIVMPVSGLSDATNNTHLYSADWSFDPVRNEYVVIRNYSAQTMGLPEVAEAIQPVRASVDIVSNVNHNRPEWEDKDDIWSLYNDLLYKIGAIKTSDEFSDEPIRWSGYNRVYNATIISSPFGWTLSADYIDVIFTSSALDTSIYLADDQFLYSQMLHLFHIPFFQEDDGDLA